MSFKFIGGSLCLDFVNTVGGRVRGGILREKLTSPADLASWGRSSFVVACPPRPSRKLRGADARVCSVETRLDACPVGAGLARAIEFREALYGIFRRAMENRAPARPHMDILNRELAAARGQQRLTCSKGAFAFTGADSILSRIALSAADLLTSTELPLLRQCGGEECGWLFLDRSRNHSRTWCDMRECGNRAKVRRFRSRRVNI